MSTLWFMGCTMVHMLYGLWAVQYNLREEYTYALLIEPAEEITHISFIVHWMRENFKNILVRIYT